MKNYLKMEIKAIKGLGLPPKKSFFNVKRLTILLCAVGIGKRMDDVFVANHKIEILQKEVPPKIITLEVFLHHQMAP